MGPWLWVRGLAWLVRDDNGEFVQNLADLPLHILRSHLAHAIPTLRKVSVPFSTRVRGFAGFMRRHQLKDALQRKRDEIGDVRADRHLTLEALAGETPIVHQRLPQYAFGLRRISAQEPRQSAHRSALARYAAAAMLRQQVAQLLGFGCVEHATFGRPFA